MLRILRSSWSASSFHAGSALNDLRCNTYFSVCSVQLQVEQAIHACKGAAAYSKQNTYLSKVSCCGWKLRSDSLCKQLLSAAHPEQDASGGRPWPKLRASCSPSARRPAANLIQQAYVHKEKGRAGRLVQCSSAATQTCTLGDAHRHIFQHVFQHVRGQACHELYLVSCKRGNLRRACLAATETCNDDSAALDQM